MWPRREPSPRSRARKACPSRAARECSTARSGPRRPYSRRGTRGRCGSDPIRRARRAAQACARCSVPPAPSWAAAWAADVALITDGRFSGGSHGFVVGHIAPEAAVGGPLALLRNGDRITIDAAKRTIEVDLTAAQLRERRRGWRPRSAHRDAGVLTKYAHLVGSASLGAVTSVGKRRAHELERSCQCAGQRLEFPKRSSSAETPASILGRSI